MKPTKRTYTTKRSNNNDKTSTNNNNNNNKQQQQQQQQQQHPKITRENVLLSGQISTYRQMIERRVLPELPAPVISVGMYRYTAKEAMLKCPNGTSTLDRIFIKGDEVSIIVPSEWPRQLEEKSAAGVAISEDEVKVWVVVRKHKSGALKLWRREFFDVLSHLNLASQTYEVIKYSFTELCKVSRKPRVGYMGSSNSSSSGGSGGGNNNNGGGGNNGSSPRFPEATCARVDISKDITIWIDLGVFPIENAELMKNFVVVVAGGVVVVPPVIPDTGAFNKGDMSRNNGTVSSSSSSSSSSNVVFTRSSAYDGGNKVNFSSDVNGTIAPVVIPDNSDNNNNNNNCINSGSSSLMAVNGLDLINSNGMDDGYSTTITTGIPAAAVAAAVASAVTATVANNNSNLQGLYPRNVKVEEEGGEEDEDEDDEEEEEEEGETAAQKGKDVINNGIGGNINNNSENIVQNSDEALHPAEHAYINCPPVGEGFSITADYSLPQAAAAHPFAMTQVPAMNRMQRRVPNTALNRNANFIQQQQQYNYYNYIQLQQQQQQQQQQYHTHHHAHIHTHNNIHIQQNSQRPQSLPPITPSNSSQQFPVWNQQYFSLSNIQSQQQQQNNGSTNIFSVNSQQQQQQQDNIYRLNNASQQQNTFNQGQQQQQQQQIPQMQYSSCTFSSPTQAYCQPPPGYDNDNENGDFTRENGAGGICDNGIDQEDNCNTFYDDSYSSPQTSWYEKDSSVTIPTNVI